MAKITFNIKYRPQIESGEYKVVTSNDEPVKILTFERKHNYPILALINRGYDEIVEYDDRGFSQFAGDTLYVITDEPEPQLTEFEKEYEASIHRLIDESHRILRIDDIKREAEKLLSIAHKEFEKEKQENIQAELDKLKSGHPELLDIKDNLEYFKGFIQGQTLATEKFKKNWRAYFKSEDIVDIYNDGMRKALENLCWNGKDAKEAFIKALHRAADLTKKRYDLTTADENAWWADFKQMASIRDVSEIRKSDICDTKYYPKWVKVTPYDGQAPMKEWVILDGKLANSRLGYEIDIDSLFKFLPKDE